MILQFALVLVGIFGVEGALPITPTVSKIRVPGVGPINGLILKTPNTFVDFYRYLGIPYSFAGRFEVARPAPEWSLPHDATKEASVCPQPGGEAQFPGGIGEDCLALSVTTPVDPNRLPGKLLPVLVFIYGGAFFFGTSRQEQYDSKHLVEHGIVIVQPNYRLGAFGWVTDGRIIPQNIALKDIRAALYWVRNNIRYFGGDPDQVVIYGESAGSVITSTLWHCNERLPYNLFRGIFMQSGQVIAPWAVQKNTANAYMTALQKTPCVVTIGLSVEKQVECLKKLPYPSLNIGDLLTVGLTDDLKGGFTGSFNSAVSIEDPENPDAMFIRAPLQQLMDGNIWTNKTILMSNTNQEMFTFGPGLETIRMRPNSAVVPSGMKPNDPNMVGGLIKSNYAGDERLWVAQPLSTFYQFYDDIGMYLPARLFIDLVFPRLTSPLYVFEFAYASEMGRFNDHLLQVGHADDLFYLWEGDLLSQENIWGSMYSKETFFKRKQMLKILSNFVKYLNPAPFIDSDLDNIQWPRVTSTGTVDYMHFDNELTIRQRPQDKNYPFWKRLYEKYATSHVTL